jgi:hypothetical protein
VELHLPGVLEADPPSSFRSFGRPTPASYRSNVPPRMIDTRIGTGGTSGHEYLDRAAEIHKVFSDLSALASFFIPRSALPSLPPDVRGRMGFRFQTS